MEKIKILLFAASPFGTASLDLNREFREIDEEIRQGEFRDNLELILVPGARLVDFLRKLNKDRPHIVHFSGHGTSDPSLILECDEAERGPGTRRSSTDRDMKQVHGGTSEEAEPEKRIQPLGKPALVEVLRSCDAGNIRVVVLNACHSRTLAEALVEIVDCVVSMDQEISDRAAIKFAASFYGALAFGRSVQNAFEQGVARLQGEEGSEAKTPGLHVKPGIDAGKLVLVGSIARDRARKTGITAAPFTVPFPRNDDFVGRDDDLQKLRAGLLAHRPVGIRPAGLTGMGGIGKTQLAVEYAYRYRDSYPNGVFWIDASEPLVEGFAALGSRLRPSTLDRSRDEQVRAAFDELNQPGESLLILDNLYEPADLGCRVAPGCVPLGLSCRVLFTTRRRDLGRFSGIEVTVLPEQPALQLLLRAPSRQPIAEPNHPEHDHARAICRMLGRLPLALELAGAFLGEWHEITLADYRERLKSEGVLATLDDEAGELTRVNLPALHEAAVATTLNSQWEALRDETARVLLTVAGQLPEAASIPEVRLGLLAGVSHQDRPGRPSTLARALKRLANVCLAEELLGGQVRFHPLVREFANRKLPSDPGFDLRLRCASNMADAYSRYSGLEEHAQQRDVAAIQEDLIAALQLCPEGGEIHARLESLLRLLHREVHNLREWGKLANPALFPQQIHNRAVAMGLDSLTREARARLSKSHDAHALLLWCVSRESPALISTLTGHRSWVNDVVFTPDGWHAVSGSDDHTLNLWDLHTGRELRTFLGHQGSVETVVLTSDGRYVLSGSVDRTLKLWDLQSGEERFTLSGHKGGIFSAKVTSDGRHALSGSSDGTIKLWDLQSARNVHTFLGHMGGVTAVAISPNGRHALSGSSDGTLRLWDLSGRCPIRVLSGHDREVTGVEITADGLRAISVSDDKTLKLWDLQTGQVLRTFPGYAGWITAVAVMPGGERILSASDDRSLRLWDLETGEESRTLFGHAGWVNALAVSADGKYALSGSDDLTLKLWDLRSALPPSIDCGHKGRVNVARVTPDGNRLVTASNDQTLKLWDLTSGGELGSFVGHSSSVTAMAITPDGQRVLSGSYDGLIREWDMETRRERRSFQGHEGGVLALAITPDGNQLISGSADRTVKIWDLETGQELSSLTGHADRVTSVAISLDGCQFLTGSNDSSLVLWELSSGQEIRSFQGHTDLVTTAVLLADGTRALSGSSDRTLRLWDLATGQNPATLRGHHARINSAALSRDDQQVISIAEDRTLMVWELATGSCVLTVPLDGFPTALALASDKATVLIGDSAGHLFGFRLVNC